jgi:peptide deformylase
MQAILDLGFSLVTTLPDLDKLQIIRYPNPLLKKVCAPVETFDASLRRLTDRMFQLMREGKGVGLAAPQVGLLIRLFVGNATGEPEDDFVCVNPKFAELTGAAEAEEGCLSIPGVAVTMRRSTSAVISAFDAEGKQYTKTGVDLQARVWLHENDHLDGRLITDHMSTADEITNRRTLKQLKEEYAGRGRK